MPLDFRILSDPSHPKFIQHLQQAPDFIDESNAAKFFNTTLSHFSKKKGLSIDIGISILVTILNVIQSPSINLFFIDNEFARSLPFGISEYGDFIFDILYFLIQQEIDFFDDDLAKKFSQQISFSPIKGLTILSYYAQQFDKIESPYPMLDILFTQKQNFLNSSTVIQYISLLSYLCVNVETFRKDRSIECFNCIAQTLTQTSVESLKTSYGALICISNLNPKCQSPEIASKLPVQSITTHLQTKDEDLLNTVLSFLLVYDVNDLRLLSQLVKSSNEKAALVIMKLCENPDNASFIATNDSWLKNPALPKIDLLKIFYCILKHRNVRKAISASQHFLTTLVNASKNSSLDELILILGILKQMPLSVKKVCALEKKNFFSNIMDSANKLNSEQSDRARYNIFEIIAQFNFTKDMPQLCSYASTEIMDDLPLASEAYRLILQLCKYEECIDEMRKMDLIHFYEERLKNKGTRKQAEEFLSLIPAETTVQDLQEYESYEEDGENSNE